MFWLSLIAEPLAASRKTKTMINNIKAFRYNKLYLPSHGRRVFLDRFETIGKTISIEESLAQTFQWIKETFDANQDGGSSAYYKFSSGWKGSYPETTGYLIPTIYDYAILKNSDEWKHIARRAADWLLEIQADEGGWQGLQIGEKCDLRIFNSGMILDGLVAAYRIEKDEKYLIGAKKGAEWILSKLDDSGFFSENNIVGGGSFDSLVCACLLMVVQLLPEEEQNKFIPKIKASLDAHLTLQNKNGWFRNCNFVSNDKALLHHLGYTLDGLIISSEILNDETYYLAAKKAAKKLLSKFEVNLELPAYIKSDWTTHHDLGNKASLCITGYSQIAIVLQKISKKEKDLRYLNAALKINDIVSSIGNYRSKNSGICFGLPGSYPINGDYQTYQFVNWAAKYHAESLLLSKNACMPKSINL